MSNPFFAKLSAKAVNELTRIRRQQSTSEQSKQSLAVATTDVAATRRRCASLRSFLREAWAHIPELAPVEYVHGWHIEFLCAHLEAITYGRLLDRGLSNRLLVNIPPCMMKSLLVSVFWPAWEWANGFANYQYIVTSYEVKACRRDTRRMRDLCLSEWYQSLYGKDWVGADGILRRGVQLAAKGGSHISSTAGGWREGMPFHSLTNKRGDRVLIDDPHSVATAESDAQRERTINTFRTSVPYRLNDPKKSAIVIIMQRLHVEDVSGVALKLKLGYVHVMLPMEFDPARRCVTPIGRDPRREAGELLFPQRFPRNIVERDKAALGPFGIAGQLQQQPYPKGGAMFKRGWFEIVPAAPCGTCWVRHWDLAATRRKGTGAGQAWTAGVKLGRGPDGVYYVGHVVRVQDEGDAVRRAIKAQAQLDRDDAVAKRDTIEISLPQDPGQAGKVQACDMVRMLDGYVVRARPEAGSKITRAEPFQAQAGAGNVKIVRGDWN